MGAREGVITINRSDEIIKKLDEIASKLSKIEDAISEEHEDLGYIVIDHAAV